MRTKYLLISTLLLLAFLLAACGRQLTPPPNVAERSIQLAGLLVHWQPLLPCRRLLQELLVHWQPPQQWRQLLWELLIH